MAQLPLALKLQPHASFENFVVGPNAVALDHVQSVAVGRRPESVWLYGQAGTGKTHMLAAACRAASESNQRAMYLSLSPSSDPEILKQLDEIDLVALDDVNDVAGRSGWDTALFSVFEARLHRGGLLVAANAAPRDCGFELADLVSRAGSAALYRLDFLDDSDLQAAVIGHAARRGLSIESSEASYLLKRVSRDLGELTACLDRIDRYSLAAQRRITIPLLREVIGGDVDGPD